MNNTKSKSILTRAAAFIFAAFLLTVITALNSISIKAMAAEETAVVQEAAIETVAFDDMFNSYEALDTGLSETIQLNVADAAFEIVPLENGGGADTDATYETVIGFLVKWLKRIGFAVGFVGAIMFALAIKSNDAEQKQNGLLTMAAGFVVAAICQAVDMFNLFS